MEKTAIWVLPVMNCITKGAAIEVFACKVQPCPAVAIALSPRKGNTDLNLARSIGNLVRLSEVLETGSLYLRAVTR